MQRTGAARSWRLGGLYEELCVAFVARTRAKDRLVYLPDLEATSRSEIFALFESPTNRYEQMCGSQETGRRPSRQRRRA